MIIGRFMKHVRGLLSRVTLSCLEKDFEILVKYDDKYSTLWRTGFSDKEPRVYIQIRYSSLCNKTKQQDMSWKGRKWYLSEHMTDSEVMFTLYTAFEMCVKHEMMEGFRVDGKILVNPHADFEALLTANEKEVVRN